MPLALPYTIANGQAIDAVPVMANFLALANKLPASAAAAAAGANSDITSLSGLTTKITTAQGGTGIDLASTPLPVAQGGTGDTGSAWTAMSGLTVVSQTGTLTTAAATGAWKRLGKTVFFRVRVAITTNGTGATSIQVQNMPFTAGGTTVQQAIIGRETAATGWSLLGYMSSGSTTMAIQKYDATYPAANGYVLEMSGTLETT